MEQRLTQHQLGQVVAEVERLSQRQQDELDLEQVKDILQELNLSPELLDEAMIQLRRREALAARRKRSRLLMAGIASGIVLVVATGLFFHQQQQRTLAAVGVQRDRLTLSQDNGNDLATISRQANAEVVYRVTLTDAPVDQMLSLSCDWIDSRGQIVHQNRYQTQSITTPVWTTHCRHQLDSVSEVGQWQVRMWLGDRVLSDASFTVQ
ncbi:MAG: DUF3859 domain-containing protein [Symploca sp. SIO2B6]|nr:DUF3859 domain-containing protein [Symploca sp. SIO2B6]